MRQALNSLSKTEMSWARMHQVAENYARNGGSRRRNLTRGFISGAVAGLAAGWVMVQFQNLWTAAEERLQGDKSQHEAHEAPSTVKAAEKISKGLLGRKLKKEEKTLAGSAVHYGFAAASGAVYGVAAEVAPQVTWGNGLPFGTVLFAAADEIALPASGLSPKANEVPFSKHIYGFASHLVFGLVAELGRRAIRREPRA